MDSFKFKGHPTAVFNDPNGMGSPKNPGYYGEKYGTLQNERLRDVLKVMGHSATCGVRRSQIDTGAFTRSWQTWIAPIPELWNVGTYYNGEQMAISLRAEVIYQTWWRHEGRFVNSIILESLDPARDSEINVVGAEPPTALNSNRRLESCTGDCEKRSWLWPFAEEVASQGKKLAKNVGKEVAKSIGEHLSGLANEEEPG